MLGIVVKHDLAQLPAAFHSMHEHILQVMDFFVVVVGLDFKGKLQRQQTRKDAELGFAISSPLKVFQSSTDILEMGDRKFLLCKVVRAAVEDVRSQDTRLKHVIGRRGAKISSEKGTPRKHFRTWSEVGCFHREVYQFNDLLHV